MTYGNAGAYRSMWRWMWIWHLLFGAFAVQNAGGSESSVAQGEKLFSSHGCAVCHGPKGKGDGAMSSILDPSPRDLSDPAVYKYGNTLVDISEILRVGIQDSAMPSFDHISPQDRSDIAHFILSLQGREVAVSTDEPTRPQPVISAPPSKKLRVHEGLGGDFTLTDQHGERFRMAETRGRIRLLFFGYASCPDVCPMTLSKVAQARELLGEAGNEAMMLMISVDGDRDTPEKLAEYLAVFDQGEILGLTGTAKEITVVLDLFKAYSEKQESTSALGYLVDHTSYLYLIDRQDVVRAIFRHSEVPEEIASAIQVLLREQPREKF